MRGGTTSLWLGIGFVVGPVWFWAERLTRNFDLGFDLLIPMPFLVVGVTLVVFAFASHQRHKHSKPG